ncbi:MAG TPA: exodeoxyribonuclease VII large subunit [Flavobacterium sp.]|jgi:exodeoxyribonuclease VII large subunit
MPEQTSDKKIFSLLEVTKSIQKTLSERYSSAFWVKAEMNKLNYYSHSGHCYPELVEKQHGKVIAQIKSNLWRDDYTNINAKFLKTLKEPLKDGIKILLLARIGFDPSHGLSLQILDIDPGYTLGDLEKEKQDTIARLHSAGIFDNNKHTRLPLLPQRIAIISVETSKGYADFLKVIEENPWHYKFFHFLFPSLLQGEKAVPGIMAQLKRIEKVLHHFDVVAIIRGGGGDVGLSCYNNFELSKAIAMFPIPVITGIGHATNETVSEMVSFQNAITPTKIAEFLIQQFHNFAVPVDQAKELIIDKSKRLLLEENNRLQSEVKLFRSATGNLILKNRTEIEREKRTIQQRLQFLFRNSSDYLNFIKDRIYRSATTSISHKTIVLTQLKDKLTVHSDLMLRRDLSALENFERNVHHLDPVNVLKRGFSITLHNGKAVKDPSEVGQGEQIETKVYNGTITSVVQNTTPNGRE